MGSKNEFRGYFGQKAFTLVEMLICIAILAILISLLNPALRKGIETARVIVCTKNLEQIQATTVYYAEDYLILPSYYSHNIGFDEMLAGYMGEKLTYSDMIASPAVVPDRPFWRCPMDETKSIVYSKLKTYTMAAFYSQTPPRLGLGAIRNYRIAGFDAPLNKVWDPRYGRDLIYLNPARFADINSPATTIIWSEFPHNESVMGTPWTAVNWSFYDHFNGGQYNRQYPVQPMVYAGSTPGKYWLHNNYTSMNYAFADGHVSLLFVPDTMNGDQPNGTGDINMWRFDQ